MYIRRQGQATLILHPVMGIRHQAQVILTQVQGHPTLIPHLVLAAILTQHQVEFMVIPPQDQDIPTQHLLPTTLREEATHIQLLHMQPLLIQHLLLM